MTLPLADPTDLGFDPARLARIDHHFQQYVDDGRLAGWQVAVARSGRVVHAFEFNLRHHRKFWWVEAGARCYQNNYKKSKTPYQMHFLPLTICKLLNTWRHLKVLSTL